MEQSLNQTNKFVNVKIAHDAMFMKNPSDWLNKHTIFSNASHPVLFEVV